MNDLDRARIRVALGIQETTGVDLGYCQHCEEAIREIEQWGDIARDALEEAERLQIENEKLRQAIRIVRDYGNLPEVHRKLLTNVVPLEQVYP